MIYIVVGASCSGKTSFTKNSFVEGRDNKEFKDLIVVTENDSYYLIGSYLQDKRTLGSDTIMRKDIPIIYDQVLNLVNRKDNKDIVLEGDKITSRNLFNKLLELNIPIKLYLIDVTPETSYKRNVENGSRCSYSHLKAVTTKAFNIFVEYKDKMNGVRINANDIRDFTTFNINNYQEYKEEGLWIN